MEGRSTHQLDLFSSANTSILRRSPRNHTTAIAPSSFTRKRPAADFVTLPTTKRLKRSPTSPHACPELPTGLQTANVPRARRALTKANLETFDNMEKGGRRAARSIQSEATKSISTTNPKFAEQSSFNGILLEELSVPPTNMVFLQEILNRRRDTASPTESSYQQYAHHISRADNEDAITHEFSHSVMLSFRDDNQYTTGRNRSFSSFPTDVGFNENLSPAQPDFVQGLEAPQFSRRVHEKLGGAIKPYPTPYAPTLSHLAGEYKAPGKDLLQAQRQVAYDGACLVYGRNEALNLIGTPDNPGEAYIQTFTTDGRTLETFANYSSNNNGRIEYHHSSTSKTILVNPSDGKHEGYKCGYRIMRNMQTSARESSRVMRDLLNDDRVVDITETDGFSTTGFTSDPGIAGNVLSSQSSTVSPGPAKAHEQDYVGGTSDIDELSLELGVSQTSNTPKRKGKRGVTFQKRKKSRHSGL